MKRRFSRGGGWVEEGEGGGSGGGESFKRSLPIWRLNPDHHDIFFPSFIKP